MARASRDFFGPRREGYYQAAQRPLNCLVFLLPLIAIYEIGSLWVGSVPLTSPPERVTAFAWIVQFLGLFAALPTYAPGLMLVALFLIWHLVSKPRSPLRLGVVGGMVVETALLTLPLLMLNKAFQFYGPMTLQASMLQATSGGAEPVGTGTELIIALTAGIYEEFIFRLLLIWIAKVALIDLLKLPRTGTMIAIVLVTAALFGAYHYVGPEVFAWRTFLFRTMAGVYLGAIFVARGFGITVGVHALYDIVLTLL